MECGVPFCHSTTNGCPLGNIIPKFITSRSTIKSILDTGSTLNYFQKISSKIDKRKKIFLPSKDVNSFMLKWIQRNKQIFQDI